MKSISTIIFIFLSLTTFGQTSKIKSPNKLEIPEMWPSAPKIPVKEARIKSIQINRFHYQDDSLTDKFANHVSTITRFNKLGDTIMHLLNKSYVNSENKTIIKHRTKFTIYKNYSEGKLKAIRKYDQHDSLIYTYDSEYKRSGIYVRDNKGNLLHHIGKSKKGKNWEVHQYHTYDKQGRNVAIYFVNQKKDTTSKVLMEYNDKGQMISRRRPMKQYNAGPITELFYYNEKDSLVRKLWINHDKIDTVEVFKNIYIYGELLYSVKSDYRRWNDHKLIGGKISTYDYNGNLLKKCQNLSCFEYKYDHNGRIYEYKVYSEDLPLVSTNLRFQYNEDGQLVKKIDLLHENSYWIWEYDDQGKLVSEKVYDKGELGREKRYFYDEKQLLTKEENTFFTGNSKGQRTIVKYVYSFYQ